MEIFKLTLSQMLMMFALILVGFLLRKKHLLPENTDTMIAKMETYVFIPALTLFTQITNCTVETLTANSGLILYGLVLILGAVALAYPLSAFFVKDHAASPALAYRRNIYKYAMVFGNYGFMGNFIILGIWGNDMFYKYSLFCFFIGIVCSSWGLFIFIPKEENASLLSTLKKGLLTPPIFALAIGIACGLLGLKDTIPSFLLSAFEKAGNCQGPLAMLLAGFVIGGYDLKELVTDKKVYLATALRLIAIPGILMVILRLLGTSEEIMILALIAFATPLGLNTIVYPAAYGGETKTGAAMTTISHTLSIITIPFMYLFFIVYM